MATPLMQTRFSSAQPSGARGAGAALGQAIRGMAGRAMAEDIFRTSEEGVATDEAALMRLAAADPQRFSVVKKRLGLINQDKLNEAADFAFAIENLPPEQQDQKIRERIATLEAQGRNASDTASLLNMTPRERTGALKVVQMLPMTPKERLDFARLGGVPAGLREFEGLTAGLTEEETEKARRIKLGLEARATARTPEREGDITRQKELAKLQSKLKLEPQVTAAVFEAKEKAKVEGERAEEARSNESALRLYNEAMGGLASALGETETGPIVGFLPAVTTNQQIAEGAQAALAPVLKQLFRSAGEGTFTDSDQRLLMQMVPTRKDTPEARVAKIKNIDAIVRTKLGEQPALESPPTAQPAAQPQPQQPAGQIKFLGFE